MASVNRVTILGNLGQDPTVRYSADGAAIANISVATSSSWKDKTTGEKREETEWVRVVFYNRLAEIAGEYLKKGKPVYVEGRLKTRKWQNKEGVDQYTTEVIAESMQLLGGRDEGQAAPAQQQRPPAQRQTPAPQAQRQPAPSMADMEDDSIPF